MPIKTKEKPCKGTGKAKGHGCKSMQLKRTYGLGHKCGCYSKWLLNTEEGQKKLNGATLRATAPRRGLEEEEKRRNNAASLQNLLGSTKQACHAYIRKRDEGKPCISCGAKWNPDFQAGHFEKAELYSSLRFEECNINGQCRICNLHLDGNYKGYTEGFIKKYGAKAFVDFGKLVVLDKQSDFKWDREELKRTRTYYKNKLKELG